MNTKKHDVPEELLSGLLANYKKPEDLIGENGLLKQLTKLLVERALEAELTEHLGHERNEVMLPLLCGVLSSLLTRPFCAVPRTSVSRIA